MAHNIKWYNTIDSTNSEAFRQFSQSDDFSVFAAEFQTNGRGQKGTSWESESSRNLTFSILLKNNSIKAENQFLIAQIVTIGIKRYLKNLGIDAKIKWPNDIYVGDKKICGILIEHFLSGDTLSGSIVGIGLNLNQRVFNSNAPNPVSVSLITGNEYDIKEQLESLAGFIHEIYFSYRNYSSGSSENRLDTEYHDSLYRLEEFHKYEISKDGKIIEARIMGIDSNACLILEEGDGTRSRYHFKEVKYLL
ncbi:MAG: biotin--[acetyl-CoA-carboxylase] ligase [Bacteroidetes bacterium GWE2_39_28]|nr:MAG: biotin--[acetyl-CoA-carboxylase] ligase [Bacteroidetes bacterium GWE2_39_28]OFY12798.1 MAG: biotin--[acetyl-CoA-carboxylase] ligase [Bacteroidetes bacterium GWF2_39_10]OFZ08343.1 MAG: biotin--[acetyl-CoA-carboxylase] ligase [Bacteroidetes bacterium RIFOXYB2_FULL_39_7]HCT93725.1 biotin--[acetyl-CoA-carboxylase] ligase [Rikenellaceae bacterium]